MKTCAFCGNDYKKAFEIIIEDNNYYFDSFECAIAKLAPICQNCGCRIIGHGIEHEKIGCFCCSHCARKSEINANAKITNPLT